MAAVNDVAQNPQNIRKYKDNKKVHFTKTHSYHCPFFEILCSYCVLIWIKHSCSTLNLRVRLYS